jgi:hypothetical protein
MALTKAAGSLDSPLAEGISGRTYHLSENECGWTNVRFVFNGDSGCMTYTNCRGEKEIPFGFGYHKGFEFPETHYPGMVFIEPAGRGYEAYASAGWVDDRKLYILCFLTDDHCGSLSINAVFDGNRVTILARKAAERFLDDYEGWMYGYC